MKTYYLNHEVALALLTLTSDEITTKDVNDLLKFIYEKATNISSIAIDLNEDIVNLVNKYPTIWEYKGKNSVKVLIKPDPNDFLISYPINVKQELLFLTKLYISQKKSNEIVRVRANHL